MIKYSIVFLLFLSAFVFEKSEPSVEITETWLLKSVNGEVISSVGSSYRQFLDDGWFINGDINEGFYEELRWVLDRDKKVVFLYTEPERHKSVTPEPKIVEISELTERTLILHFGKEVAMFENLNIAAPEVQESFKLQEADVPEDNITETPKYLIEEGTPQEETIVVEEATPKASTSENKEERIVPEEKRIEMPDSDPVKTKRKKGPRMEIAAEASAIIGKWKIVAVNMAYGVMGKIETNKNDEGYFDFKKDGSVIMNIRGQQTSTDGMKWVIDENNNTIFYMS